MRKFRVGDRIRVAPEKRDDGSTNPLMGTDRVYTIKCSNGENNYYLFGGEDRERRGSNCSCPSEDHTWVIHPRDMVLVDEKPKAKSTQFADQFSYIGELEQHESIQSFPVSSSVNLFITAIPS